MLGYLLCMRNAVGYAPSSCRRNKHLDMNPNLSVASAIKPIYEIPT